MTFDVNFVEQCERMNVDLKVFAFHSHDELYYTKAETDSKDGILQTNINNVSNRVTTAESNIDTLESSVSSLQSQVSVLSGVDSSYGERLSALESTDTDYDDRLDELESSIETLYSDITALEGTDTTYGDRITECEGDIDSIESSISSLGSADTSMGNRITTLENNRTQVKATIDGWNQVRFNATETPNVTLPSPTANKVQILVYLFTAATANATFTAPSGYILGDVKAGFAGLSAGNAITYTDLSVGYVYKAYFNVISASQITLTLVRYGNEE